MHLRAAPAADRAASVLAADFVEHSHPQYGGGYFCTPDVFARIATLDRLAARSTDTPEVYNVPAKGLQQPAASMNTFDRRWRLAKDGFGLQRDDVGGNYVHIDDAIDVLQHYVSRLFEAQNAAIDLATQPAASTSAQDDEPDTSWTPPVTDRAADMLTAYAEQTKALGRYAEEHYIPEVEHVIEELRALTATQAPAVPAEPECEGLTRKRWTEMAERVYARECARYIAGEQDWHGPEGTDPYEEALENIEGAPAVPATDARAEVDPAQAKDGEFEAAVDLLEALKICNTNGASLALILRYRLETLKRWLPARAAITQAASPRAGSDNQTTALRNSVWKHRP
jgi:hypothetical protein